MAESNRLLIFGASARAAAFSALRAGLSPWCADLFADADLQAVCPATRVSFRDYPQRFYDLARGKVPGPWMYTGGLENHDALVHAIANQRPLFGNDEPALRAARSPPVVVGLLGGARIPHPALFDEYPAELPSQGRWLVKPVAGAGGRGIRFFDGTARPERRAVYLQEHIDGEPCSAVYVADGAGAELLGVTAQLIGENHLHAAPFHYCGSIGPRALTSTCQQAFERLGQVLAAGCRLRGLFGVDCVLADDVPYPVEVNPRYPASVEVLELALGIEALSLHRTTFDPEAVLLARSVRTGSSAPSPAPRRSRIVGKAILFARAPLSFPVAGPWSEALGHTFDPWQLPAFADVPHPGERIEAGRPILTFFARADSVAECRETLWQRAAELERWLPCGAR